MVCFEQLDMLMEHNEPKVAKTWFPYTSGKIGPYYIQSIVVEENGEHYRRAVDALKGLVMKHSSHVDAICGGETRDWDFSNPVAYSLGLPHAKLFKERKPLGASIEGKKFALISDLNNQGSSVKTWQKIIAHNGGSIVHAYFYIDRMETGVQVVKDLELERHAVIEFGPCSWTHMKKVGYITSDQHANVLAYLKNSELWGREQLIRHPEKLKELLQGSSRDKEKARKILEIGYPGIEEKL